MFFDKLKKLLEGGFAQINPFDGGKTFNSVMSQQPQQAAQPKQAPSPVVRQQVQAAPAPKPRFNFLDSLKSFNPTNITKPVLGVTLGDIGRQLPNAVGETAQGVKKVADFVAPATTEFAGKALNTAQATGLRMRHVGQQITGQKVDPREEQLVNQLEQKGFVPKNIQTGKANVGEVGKEMFKQGVPVGLELASFQSGLDTAKMGLKKALPEIAKQALAFGGVKTGANMITGEGSFADRMNRLPGDLARNTAEAALQQGIGHVIGRTADKVLPVAGEALSRVAQSPKTQAAVAALKDQLRFRNDRGGYIRLPDGSLSRDSVGRFTPANKQGAIDIHPDDQKLMASFIDYVRLGDAKSNPDPRFEAEVSDMLDHYGIKRDPKSLTKVANEVQNTLENNTLNPASLAEPPKQEPGPLLSPQLKGNQVERKVFDSEMPDLAEKDLRNMAASMQDEQQFLKEANSSMSTEELSRIYNDVKAQQAANPSILDTLKDQFKMKKRGGYARLPFSGDIPPAVQMAGRNAKDLEGAFVSASNADNLQGPERDLYDYVLQQRQQGKPFDEIYVDIQKNGVPSSMDATTQMDQPQAQAANALEAPSNGNEGPVLTANPTPEGQKPSKFAESVVKTTETSPELSAAVEARNPTYSPVKNADQLAASEQLLAKGTREAVADVSNRMSNTKMGKIDAQTVSDAIATIKKLDSTGDKIDMQTATDLTDALAKHLSSAGQTIQAASLLANKTPEGLLFSARNALQKAGIEVTPEIQQALADQVQKIAGLTGEERLYANAELQKMVADLIPSSLPDKAIALWKAGLLTGIKTQTGNTLSGASSLVLKKASDPLAALIDRGVSVFTGKRGKVATFGDLLSGGGEGLQRAAKSLRTGVDERNLENIKFDQKQVNFGDGPLGKLAQKYVNTVFGLMGAADKPLYYATLRNNLDDLAKTEAINMGLTGGKKAAFIKDFKLNPPEEAFQTATDAAEKMVFANDTWLSNKAKALRSKTGESPIADAAVDVIMPFTKVPSAVVTRLVDYTPAGAVKTAIKAIRDAKAGKPLNQRALSEGLAEAGLGTGVLAIGYALREAGLMTGSYPKDQREQELWKLEGKQENSIKVGDKWQSLNYTSPLGQLMATGGKVADAKKEGGSNAGALAAGGFGIAKSVMDQSFLQGVQGALDAVNDPNASAEKYAKSQASSVVPTLVNDIGNATDPVQREANSVQEGLMGRIPGVRTALNPKRDAFGAPLEQKAGPIDTLVNPFRPSTEKTATPLTSELRRLQDLKLGVMPDIQSDYFGKDTTISKNQQNELSATVGPKIQSAWNKIIADPRYQKLSDEDKQATLKKAMTDTNAAERFLSGASFGAPQTQEQFRKQSADVKRIYAGGDAGAFKTDATTPKEKYQQALDKYNQDKQDGTVSEVNDIKRKADLNRLKVESDFSQDAADLHSMSKAQVYSYLSSNAKGKQLADELLKLDDALTAAGIQDKNKFRDKYGNPTIRPKDKSASGKKQKALQGGSIRSKYQKNFASLMSGAKVSPVTAKTTKNVAIRKSLKKAVV